MIVQIVLGLSLLTVPPPPAGMPIWVEAAPLTAYRVKCHIRTFKDPVRGYANTYSVESRGAFKDRIPSPNAQCLFSKITGDGSVTLHIFKTGDHSATSRRPGQWMRLEVW